MKVLQRVLMDQVLEVVVIINWINIQMMMKILIMRQFLTHAELMEEGQ